MIENLDKYYSERFSMMSTEGWTQLMEDTQVMRDSYANIASINSVDELNHRKGMIEILDWLLSLKTISELTYNELDK